jgi:hypothetical protein
VPVPQHTNGPGTPSTEYWWSEADGLAEQQHGGAAGVGLLPLAEAATSEPVSVM